MIDHVNRRVAVLQAKPRNSASRIEHSCPVLICTPVAEVENLMLHRISRAPIDLRSLLSLIDVISS